MKEPQIPVNEDLRIKELQSLDVLDSETESTFDSISDAAKTIAKADIALVSLVDSNRQWFKSCVGASLGQSETPRAVSFCGHAILTRNPLIIEDATQDERFSDNPLVTAPPNIRFYAGFPLILSSGYIIGTLCVICRRSHQLDLDQINALKKLAAIVVSQLEYRKAAILSASSESFIVDRSPRTTETDRFRSVDSLISRDQLIDMLGLLNNLEPFWPFSFLRCRLRDYDRINALLGGVFCDSFIEEASRRLIAALPKGCSVARLSDSEFGIILPYLRNHDEILPVIKRLMAFVGQPYRSNNHSLPVTISIGVVPCSSKLNSISNLFSDSIIAERAASRSSGNGFKFIDIDTRSIALESYLLESELRQALANKAIDPFFQTIVALDNNSVIGFEALARWRHNDEWITPDRFLPLCAECGLTGELDLVIAEKVFAALPLIARSIPVNEIVVSINISACLLEDADMRSRLLALIDAAYLPLNWKLQVELVEDAFRDESDEFDQFLAQLAQRNIYIAIDDFGAGYSSFARLASLPIQVVKIDKKFAGLLDDSESGGTYGRVLATMLTLIKDLGMTAVAEGVETESQRAWLQARGVARGQGFLFAKPLGIAELMAGLQQSGYLSSALPSEPLRRSSGRRRRPWTRLQLPFLDRRNHK